jgi:hypothetical protein
MIKQALLFTPNRIATIRTIQLRALLSHAPAGDRQAFNNVLPVHFGFTPSEPISVKFRNNQIGVRLCDAKKKLRRAECQVLQLAPRD